jgi:multisubunit Na+/H+ antiporter MnhC subunit
MAAILYPLFTFCHLFLLCWAISLYQEFHKLGLVALIIIIAAITYDNLIVSIGRWIGEGKLLLWLSQPRFIGHVLLTPLSVVAAYSLCLQAGLEWASNQIAIRGIWLVTILLVTAEISTYYKEFTPTPIWTQSTLRYTNSAYKCLPVASILTTIVIGGLGEVIWQQLNYPWLLIGSVIMFIGGAIPQKIAGPVICSGVEIALIAGFCLTATQVFSQVNI